MENILGNLLAFSVFAPFLTGMLLLLIPAENIKLIRSLALTVMGLMFVALSYLLYKFDFNEGGFQFIWSLNWIPSLGISLKLGLDGISLPLFLLTGIVGLTAMYISSEIHKRQKEYYILLLSLITGIAGTFCALDVFFFYFFYEMAVIPMYLLIGIWGSLPSGKHGRTKEYATMKLTLYLTAGAVLALLGLLIVYFSGAHSFDYITTFNHLKENPLPAQVQILVFGLLLFGFGFLASLWPFHTWSPIGYAAAPTAASMMHAGVLKKLGVYGLLRLGIAFAPEGAKAWAEIIVILATLNIIYAGLAALRQKDWKFVIGYSSVSHMGYIILGLATLNITGISGAVLLMFAHGVMAALTFALIGFFYHQTHNRTVTDLSGLAHKLPFIGVCMTMALMASSGLPGFANFASEIMVFIGAWQVDSIVFKVATLCAVWGIVITAAYLLWALRQSFFGPYVPKWENLHDPKGIQKWPYIALILILLTIGIYPRFFTDSIQKSVALLVPQQNQAHTSNIEYSKVLP